MEFDGIGMNYTGKSLKTGATSLTVCDFDGNDSPDVISGSATGKVFWSSYDGVNGFSDHGYVSVAASDVTINDVATGNIDGDNFVDVVAARSSGTIAWTEYDHNANGGEGGFAPVKYLIWGSNISDVVIGNFDGDPNTDVIVTNGRYVGWAEYDPISENLVLVDYKSLASSGTNLRGLVLGDFDDNDVADVVVGRDDGYMAMVEYDDVTGTFAADVTYLQVGTCITDMALAPMGIKGDLNASGQVDFIDFAIFAIQWLETDCGLCGGADLTGEGNVELDDLSELVTNWLNGL